MPVQVPNVLADHVMEAEAFYDLMVNADDNVLDMQSVTFIRPHGVIALVTMARAYHHKTGQPLVMKNLQTRVHQYLERVDLFKVCGDYITADSELETLFDRNQPTPNLLELTPVQGALDVVTVITQAERIFSFWLQVRNLHSLLNVLSELCSNVYQHSGDSQGVVLIQTHKAVTKGQVRVRVSIGDMGIGVQGSLQNRFGELGSDALDYLMEAMSGRTSRHTGRGGLGLRVVQREVGEGGGYMWLRSDTAAILSDGVGSIEGKSQLSHVPGTQVSVDFHAPLPPDMLD